MGRRSGDASRGNRPQHHSYAPANFRKSRLGARSGSTQGWQTGSKPPVGAGARRADLDSASSTTDRVVPAGTDSVVISNSAVGIGGRWDTFQSRLRERRKEAVTGCDTCSGESAVKRGSESVDTLRKAV